MAGVQLESFKRRTVDILTLSICEFGSVLAYSGVSKSVGFMSGGLLSKGFCPTLESTYFTVRGHSFMISTRKSRFLAPHSHPVNMRPHETYPPTPLVDVHMPST